ncbi:MAG TPA: divalent-cation tolerance protein CutA [Aggregatilineaceae bacterium]|nr:divalent-cation tolerance protein CutA [Aggregatilineaceae bacterium]
MDEPYCVVLVTAASEEQARTIARTVLEGQLAACVNLVPVQSMYVWEGAIQDDREVLMIIKTRRDVFEALMNTVKAAHSYEVPEIIGMPVVVGSQAYLEWISNVTK